MRTALVIALCLTASSARGFDLVLDPDALQQAIALGQTGFASRRTDFHRPYRITIGTAPLDFIDVVTPFRRIVLAAEAQLRAGQRLFGQREALATLGDQPGRIEFRLELTFHPLNTLIGVPGYDVVLATADGKVITPLAIDRIPRFGPRVDGVSAPAPTQGVGLSRGPSQPLLGGTVLAIFDGNGLDRMGRYDVLIREDSKVIARGPVDLSRLR